MFEKDENEMHFKTTITVTQILRFQAGGFGGQVGETEMALQKQWGRVPGESRDACHFHTLKRHLDFPVPGSILGGGDGVVFMVLAGDALCTVDAEGHTQGCASERDPPAPARLPCCSGPACGSVWSLRCRPGEGLLLWRQRGIRLNLGFLLWGLEHAT